MQALRRQTRTPCAGSICSDLSRYLKQLCQAVLQAAAICEEDIMGMMYGLDQSYSGRFKDDLTGQVLGDDLSRESRATEIEFFDSKGVWLKVPCQRSFE